MKRYNITVYVDNDTFVFRNAFIGAWWLPWDWYNNALGRPWRRLTCLVDDRETTIIIPKRYFQEGIFMFEEIKEE